MVPGGTWDVATLDAVRRRFESVYAETYGYSDAQEAVEIVTWKLNAAAPPPVLALPVPTAVGTEVAQARKGTRPAYFPECGGFVECPVYDRYLLASGMTLEGPALIEERESTALILPGDTGRVDRFGNVLITVSSVAKGI